MKIQGQVPYFFDIETTGLSGIKDDFILGAIRSQENTYVFKDIAEFFDYIENDVNGILVGFNTETFRGGFDLPFLRAISIRYGYKWPFSGLKHLDIFPLIQNYLNTSDYIVKLPSKSSLKKADLTKLAFENSINYTTTKETYDELMKLHEKEGVNWLDYASLETSSANDLQSVYIKFFDFDKNEEYIDGGDVPILYEKGNIGEIAKHCYNDVARLDTITKHFLPLLPDYFIDRNIITL